MKITAKQNITLSYKVGGAGGDQERDPDTSWLEGGWPDGQRGYNSGGGGGSTSIYINGTNASSMIAAAGGGGGGGQFSPGTGGTATGGTGGSLATRNGTNGMTWNNYCDSSKQPQAEHYDCSPDGGGGGRRFPCRKK